MLPNPLIATHIGVPNFPPSPWRFQSPIVAPRNYPDAHSNARRITEFFRLSKEAIGLFRAAVPLLPKGHKAREDAAAKLQAAEESLEAAKVSLAKKLGYPLCKCTFPPQIMQQTGRHPKLDDLIFKCAKCGDQIPTANELKIREKNHAAEERRRSAPNRYF
jgi:hypothetical protein